MTVKNSIEENTELCKKKYVKPTLEIIELRSEERIAKNSWSCYKSQGRGNCDPTVTIGPSP